MDAAAAAAAPPAAPPGKRARDDDEDGAKGGAAVGKGPGPGRVPKVSERFEVWGVGLVGPWIDTRPPMTAYASDPNPKCRQVLLNWLVDRLRAEEVEVTCKWTLRTRVRTETSIMSGAAAALLEAGG